MHAPRPFSPTAVSSKAISATTSSSALQIQTQTVNGVAVVNRAILVNNIGANDVAIEFGSSTSVTATFPTGSTASSVVVSKNTSRVFASAETCVAAVTQTGTTTVIFTPGEGGI